MADSLLLIPPDEITLPIKNPVKQNKYFLGTECFAV
jgi:hypothetical protein